MSVRKWHINEALFSVRRLAKVQHELTMEEVLACLDFEAATQRRRSITDRLITRATSLNEKSFLTSLQDKYHG